MLITATFFFIVIVGIGLFFILFNNIFKNNENIRVSTNNQNNNNQTTDNNRNNDDNRLPIFEEDSAVNDNEDEPQSINNNNNDKKDFYLRAIVNCQEWKATVGMKSVKFYKNGSEFLRTNEPYLEIVFGGIDKNVGPSVMTMKISSFNQNWEHIKAIYILQLLEIIRQTFMIIKHILDLI